jgi:DNA-binding NtrC family response regulator
VLNDVSRLTLEQQIMVFDWMNTVGRNVQVISLTRRCPLAQVQEGAFLEGLLYRLNVVRLELKAA